MVCSLPSTEKGTNEAMLRRTFPYILGVVFVAGLANTPVVTAAASDRVIHSGIVTSVDAARGTLILQEMGPWNGPDTHPTSVSIALQPIPSSRSSSVPTSAMPERTDGRAATLLRQ